MTAATLAVACLLALVHLLAGRLRFVKAVPRSRWLSAGSGISLAYVFVHILPELDRSQDVLREASSSANVLNFLEHHVYLVALLGLLAFYGLEDLVASAKAQNDPGETPSESSPGIFWLHIGSFSFYNILIGYLLLHRENGGLLGLAEFSFAMVVHFLVNDYGLRRHHQESYDHTARWCLAAAVLVGWGLGQAVAVPEAAVAVLFGLLAGAVILNVLKEELPKERETRFWALAAGAAAYAALLIIA